MAGLVLAIHVGTRIATRCLEPTGAEMRVDVLTSTRRLTAWMPRTRPGMTPNGSREPRLALIAVRVKKVDRPHAPCANPASVETPGKTRPAGHSPAPANGRDPGT